MTGANLAAVTGIDYTKGVKVKVRITTTTANATSITFLSFDTTTTAVAQQTTYPLDIVNVLVQNVVAGSAWRLEKVSDSSLLGSGVAVGGDFSVAVSYPGSSFNARLKVRKGTTAPKYIPYETLVVVSASGGTAYVSQSADTIAS